MNNPSQEPAKTKVSRRDLLGNMRNLAIAGVALGGVGWYTTSEVCASIREQDLSKIGQGVPTVVQIHDPNCSLCVALQREARAAVGEFNAEEIIFLVANIQTAEGRRLASAHGVGHVTLLLFDGEGRRRTTLTGSNDREVLEQAFRRHVTRYGTGS
ncbi:MAG: hypothetical protein AAF530_24010 [Pseudomonadota bacterium]